MKIGDFLNAHVLRLELASSNDGYFTAVVKTPTGGKPKFLSYGDRTFISCFGSGKTPNLALKNLCEDLSGRTMVLTSQGKRKEIEVPSTLVV